LKSQLKKPIVAQKKSFNNKYHSLELELKESKEKVTSLRRELKDHKIKSSHVKGLLTKSKNRLLKTQAEVSDLQNQLKLLKEGAVSDLRQASSDDGKINELQSIVKE
jgi:septal ring factor EnvC (AmiA/AmiB activator)